MKKTVTTPYDVAEHLRTPEEMAAYLEACMEEAARVAETTAQPKAAHGRAGARRRA